MTMFATYMEHPDTPDTRPPTKAQIELLRKIVATNGGGVSSLNIPERTLQGLVARHLVQGKLNNPHRVVHTRAGLDLIRRLY